jgi:TetR/AcrR family tetracycline transcriptional repressor
MGKAGKRLTRSRIIRAAFAVLDDQGLEGLSLRLVAARLGVQAPALYWHVRNKAELTSLMAATLSSKGERAGEGVKHWRSRLLAYGRGLRCAILRHRDAARLCAAGNPVESPEVVATRLAAPLIADGLDARTALSFQAAVVAYTLGWVVYEQSQPMHDFLEQLIDFDESFEAGLSALVRGFRTSSRQSRASPRFSGASRPARTRPERR